MGMRPRTCGQVVVGMVSADRVVGRGLGGVWPVVWFHALVMAHCATVRGIVLLQCLFSRLISIFPQCGRMVFPGLVIMQSVM